MHKCHASQSSFLQPKNPGYHKRKKHTITLKGGKKKEDYLETSQT